MVELSLGNILPGLIRVAFFSSFACEKALFPLFFLCSFSFSHTNFLYFPMYLPPVSNCGTYFGNLRCKKTTPKKPRFTSNGESRLLNSSNRKKQTEKTGSAVFRRTTITPPPVFRTSVSFVIKKQRLSMPLRLPPVSSDGIYAG